MIKICSKPWLFILLVITACNSAEEKQQVTEELSTITLNKIKLAGLNGQPVDLSLYKGKTVFINFWATWCKPCVQEMPSLQRLTEKMKDKNIVFFFASDESSEEISEFKISRSYPMELVRAENLVDLNIVSLPTTFVFNKNGALVFSEMGAREWDSNGNIAEINQIINQ